MAEDDEDRISEAFGAGALEIREENRRRTEGSGFVESAFSAAGQEFIGGEPGPGVERYREQNPVAGTVSELSGYIAPYLLWEAAVPLRALKGVKGLGRVARYADEFKEVQPFRAGLAREFAKFAPVEGARTAAAASLYGGESAFDIAQEGAINLGAAGVIGGSVGKVLASRPLRRANQSIEREFQEIATGYDLDSPAQLRLRQVLGNLNRLPESMRQRSPDNPGISDLIKGLKKEVAFQDPPSGRNPIGEQLDLWGVGSKKDAKEAQRVANRYMTLGKDSEGKTIAKSDSRKLVTRLAPAIEGEARPEIVRRITAKAEFPKNWEAYAQFPRVVRFKTEKAAREAEKSLERSFELVDSQKGLWINREKTSGMFVMAKKVSGERRKFSADDQFVFWKTDSPDKFFKNSGFGKNLSENVFRMEAVAKAEDKPFRKMEPAALFSERMRERILTAPMMGQEMPAGRFIESLASRMIPAKRAAQLAHELRGTIDVARRFQRRYLAPALHEVRHSDRAMRIMAYARSVFDFEEARALEAVHGKLAHKHGQSIFTDILAKTHRTLSEAEAAIDDLTEEGLRDFQKAVLLRYSPEEAIEAGFSSDAVKLLRAANRLDRGTSSHVKNIEEMTKVPSSERFQPLANHYLISRSWEGELRMPMYGPKNNMMAVASGHSPKQVKTKAEEIARIAKEDGFDLHWNQKDIYSSSPDDDFDLLKDLIRQADIELETRWMREAFRPLRFQERMGVRGSEIEMRPLDKEDIRKMISGNVRASHRYAADKLVRYDMEDQLAKLAQEEPDTAAQIVDRLNDLAGKKRRFNKFIEDKIDSVITPHLGFSAVKATRTLNETLYHLTLGMGDLGFGLLNALTFVQNSLPEMALLLNAPTRNIARYYRGSLVQDSAGRIKEARFLEPLRIMQQGFKEMGGPDKVLRKAYDRAIDEGVIAPRLAEEVLGEKSKIGEKLREAARGELGIFETLKSFSSWIPAKSEEFSRATAFTQGHIVGRDFWGLKGEELYRFSAQFTDQVMYRYAVQDRAKITTGAIGGLFGLFKTFMLNYIGNMTRYIGQIGYNPRNFDNWKPLLWMQAGTFSIAGAGGIPAYGAIDGLSKAFTDKSFLENTYDWWGFEKELEDYASQEALMKGSDFIQYGLPGLFGASLQSRAAVPGSDIPRDLSQLYSFVIWDRLAAIPKFVGDGITAFEATGQHPGRDAEVMRSLGQIILPRTLQRGMQNVEGGVIRSLRTGNSLVDGLSAGEQILNATGLTPLDVQKSYDLASELFKDQKLLRERISAFGARVAEARRDGDYDMVSELYRRAYRQGVPIDSVQKSADAYQIKHEESLLQREVEQIQSRGRQRALGID